ncbi:hypothetical protein B0T26DRAFT_364599 [Lasiosphaeria miniovina]|uniref:Uncharacterized protein n=1 Tax=Lasiosphaeria miniovina TaxID=1954250 RepID=A0AA40DRF4_9PEZI|nr:uncharacterized protein B0T26DRAFT_364599 [Lasiosphaeria miniovina]KAK0713434.1 hypothetical protein B0T26DRAFT_364599 [Lasiosphaeria miniovina]
MMHGIFSACLVLSISPAFKALPHPLADTFVVLFRRLLSMTSSSEMFTRVPCTVSEDESESSESFASLISEPRDNVPTPTSLADLIEGHLKTSSYDNKDFLPEGLIEQLVTEEAVRKQLGCPKTRRRMKIPSSSIFFTKRNALRKSLWLPSSAALKRVTESFSRQ